MYEIKKKIDRALINVDNLSNCVRHLKKFLPLLDFDWQPNILQNDFCAIPI